MKSKRELISEFLALSREDLASFTQEQIKLHQIRLHDLAEEIHANCLPAIQKEGA